MKPEEFFEALSDIDENMVSKAKPFREEETIEPIIITPKKRGFRPFYAAAACLGVLAAGTAVIIGIGMNRVKNIPLSTDTDTSSPNITDVSDITNNAEYKVFGQYPDDADFVYEGDFSNLEMIYPACIEYGKYYSSYRELADDSLMVVGGTFIDDTRQNDTRSFNTLKVTKVLKGDVAVGDEVVIGDTYVVADGGVNAATLLTPMLKNEGWIYFLQKSDGDEDSAYYPVGGYQGRYPDPYGGNKYFPYVENDNGVTLGGNFNNAIYNEIKELFGLNSDTQAEYSQNYVYPYMGDYSEITGFSRPKDTLTEHYGSYEELAADSDLIVHGAFCDYPHQDVDPNPDPDIPLGTNIFSQCKFKIYDVIKGGDLAAPQDIIIIAQSVGVYGDRFISTSQLSPMVNGDEWYYFLKKDSSGVYHAVNDSDGRYPPMFCNTNFTCSVFGYDNYQGYTYKEYLNQNIYDRLVEVMTEKNQGFQPQTGCHKIFDAIADMNDYTTDKITFRIGEYPDVEFARSTDVGGTQIVEAVYNGKAQRLYSGLPVESIYLCDLNGDGKREICSTAAFGSGIVDSRIYACDYENGKCYVLEDRGNYDFILKEENNKLMVSKTKYGDYGAEPVSYEELALSMMKEITDEGEKNPDTQTSAAESNTDTEKISFNKDIGDYSVCVDVDVSRCTHGNANHCDLGLNDHNICIKDKNGKICASLALQNPCLNGAHIKADCTDFSFDVLELDTGNVLAVGIPTNGTSNIRCLSLYCFDGSQISCLGTQENAADFYPVINGSMHCEGDCIYFNEQAADGSYATNPYIIDCHTSTVCHDEAHHSQHHAAATTQPPTTSQQTQTPSSTHHQDHHSNHH